MMSDAMLAPTEVTLVIPAIPRMVSVARTAAAGLAAEVDFTLDDIDNVRIAVNELVSILVEAEPVDGVVTMVFGLESADVFTMTASVVSSRRDPALDPLSRQIVAAVTADYSVEAGMCRLRIVREG